MAQEIEEQGAVLLKNAGSQLPLNGSALQSGISVVADRPFLYFLRDQPTGAVIFMGRVLDPGKS